MRRLRILSLSKLLLRRRKLLLRHSVIRRHLLSVVRLLLRVLFLLLLIVGWLHIFVSYFCNNNNKLIYLNRNCNLILCSDNATNQNIVSSLNFKTIIERQFFQR